jgi:hypothetical protein
MRRARRAAADRESIRSTSPRRVWRRKPGHLHGEQIVAGGDARAAHGDHVAGDLPASRLPAAPSSPAGKKTFRPARVGGERVIDRAGHMAGDRIDGFDAAGKALRRARIHQQTAGPCSASISSAAPSTACRSTRGVKRGLPERGRGPRRIAGFERAAGGDPCLEAAVEHGDFGNVPSQRSSHHARAANEPLASS